MARSHVEAPSLSNSAGRCTDALSSGPTYEVIEQDQLSVPPTGSWTTTGTVSIIVSLAKGTNTMTFYNASGWAPNLDAIRVQAISGSNGYELIGTASGRCLDMYNNTMRFRVLIFPSEVASPIKDYTEE